MPRFDLTQKILDFNKKEISISTGVLTYDEIICGALINDRSVDTPTVVSNIKRAMSLKDNKDAEIDSGSIDKIVDMIMKNPDIGAIIKYRVHQFLRQLPMDDEPKA